jgi:predicted nucleotidyltransferase
MKKHSGKFVLRVPSAFHLKLSLLAAQQGMSLNRFCFERIKASLALPSTTLVNKEDSIQNTLVQQLVDAEVPLIGVVMFGSSARGEARDSSDVDLLLVLDSHRPISRELYKVWDDCLPKLQVSSDVASKLSPQFVHLPSSPEEAGSLWFECAIEGLIWSDTDFQIGKFLAHVRAAILRGDIRRESSHGHHYWIKSLKQVS